MIVHWTENCIKIVPKVVQTKRMKDDEEIVETSILGDVVLAPGYNEIPDEDWALARDTAKQDIENKRIVEEWVKAEKSKAGEEPKLSTEIDGNTMVPAQLKDINRPKVIDVVTDTYHVPTLQSWLDTDMRQDVRLELVKRIDEINKRGQ